MATTINIREFPKELHARCKAAAALTDKSLRLWIIEAMREKLESDVSS